MIIKGVPKDILDVADATFGRADSVQWAKANWIRKAMEDRWKQECPVSHGPSVIPQDILDVADGTFGGASSVQWAKAEWISKVMEDCWKQQSQERMLRGEIDP